LKAFIETFRFIVLLIKAFYFLNFFIKLSMLIQKRETISVVSLFCNHLSADLREPRVPLRILRGAVEAVVAPRFMYGSVEQIVRDVPAPRLRAEYFMG